MAIAPRVVIVTRPTEYDEMLGRHGSRHQVTFFLDQRGQTIDTIDERHALQQRAVQLVSSSVPVDWRRANLTRDDLSRFMFGPEDVIVAVGQDGLVANVAKYLSGQPVVGVNPDPQRNPGVLARRSAGDLASILAAIINGTAPIEHRAMVEVTTDDGQSLRALNEVFIGHAAHQSAKYAITVDGQSERHSSSGVLVGTGTGSTGWCSSVHRERQLPWALPDPTSTDLAWFVREAWPSPWTDTRLTAGRLTTGELVIRCDSDQLVVFGDGIEDDHIALARGQVATVRLAQTALALM